MEHEVKRWKTNNKPLCERNIANIGAITFYEVSPILLLITTGLVVSILLFLRLSYY